MAKVHVISTPERIGREADLVDRDVDSLWGSPSRLCRDEWFYIIMFNLIMGLIFIVMDVVYYDTCFVGPYPTRTVPAFLFLIGISQMSLSIIFPAFIYFLKSPHLHVMIRIPFMETTKKTSVLLAGLVVSLSVTITLIFVILGLSFASVYNTCHSALILFTQIVCSLYIVGSLAVMGFLIFKKRELISMDNFSENNRNQEYSKEEEGPPTDNGFKGSEDNIPYPDNLSEVHLPEGHREGDAKPRLHPSKMGRPSAEFMLARYLCVVTGVIWLVSAVPGIPILVLGATFHDRCTKYLNVPVWAIVHGTVLLVGAIALVGGWCAGRGRKNKKRLIFLIPALTIIAFLLIWPIVGVAWSDQARTSMLRDPEERDSSCTRSFVTGVLITSAVYAIPIFILGFIISMTSISLLIASIVVFVMWSLYEGQQGPK